MRKPAIIFATMALAVLATGCDETIHKSQGAARRAWDSFYKACPNDTPISTDYVLKDGYSKVTFVCGKEPE